MRPTPVSWTRRQRNPHCGARCRSSSLARSAPASPRLQGSHANFWSWNPKGSSSAIEPVVVGRAGFIRDDTVSLHIICERDVGLFSLIQQVIAGVTWATYESRVPIVYFTDRTAYWTPSGYHGRDTVWEYYFEPVIPTHPASTVPEHVQNTLSGNPPSPSEPGYFVDEDTFVSCHFGDHPLLESKALAIPYLWDDPDDALRRTAAEVIQRFVRPRPYILHKVAQFVERHFYGRPVIGVHARGTDATSSREARPHRQGSLVLSRYGQELQRLMEGEPDSLVFVATDDDASLQYFIDAFGSRVTSYGTVRHKSGEAAGSGPTGWIMPAYIAADRARAAQNGEEAVIDYLLLSRCNYLIHNGSSLARTALLAVPELGHTNTHRLEPEPPAVSPSLVSRVRELKAKRQVGPKQYRDQSQLALVVHSFNRESNIDRLLGGLRHMGDHELIVCDDGSVDGSRSKWQHHLDGPNDFLIQSNDIHEIRILDRAIRFARAEVVCLVQDDDQIPVDTDWLARAFAAFETFPSLAILGGFMGFGGLPGAAEVFWGPAPFRFVHHVNIGPYFLRKRHYEVLGGWDHSFSKAGEPGICFDNELCLRAWTRGLQVGYDFASFKGPPGEYKLNGGTVLFSPAVRLENKIRNEGLITSMYSRYRAHIDQLVREANDVAQVFTEKSSSSDGIAAV
jgi:hypothetical protein